MKKEIIKSIESSLETLRQLSDTQEILHLTKVDLEKYDLETLQALDVYLKKNIQSLGDYFNNYASLLETYNNKREIMVDKLIVKEKIIGTKKEIESIESGLMK